VARTGGLATIAAALLVAMPAPGADLDALERPLREAWAQRARLVEERTRRMGEAAVLADEIARRKDGSRSAPRADRGLEDALKRFDRVAGQLDEVDRKIADRERAIATLRRRFEEAASAEASRLSGRAKAGSVGRVARELDAIDQARRRVAGLCASEPAFRPVLEVSRSPDDGATEIRHKLLLLEAERDRVMNGIEQADADARVLSARILVKRRLAAELETAARTAGSELELLRREAENAAEALHDLDAQRETSSRHKAALVAALAQVERRLDELRAALGPLALPKGYVR